MSIKSTVSAPDVRQLDGDEALPVTFFYSPSTGEYACQGFCVSETGEPPPVFYFDQTPRAGRIKVVYKGKSFDLARVLLERDANWAYPNHRISFVDENPRNLRRENLSLIPRYRVKAYRLYNSGVGS